MGEFRGLDKLEEAVAAYKNALVINPNSAKAYNNMGITLKHQGKLDEAIVSYNKALALKPNYVEAAKNLVQLPIGSIGEKTISESNKKSSSICANISDQSEKLFFEANLLSHQGKYDEAFEIFVDANYIKSYNNILTMKTAQIKYDAAIKRVSSWSVNLQPVEKAPVKKLFILGPSRSGKSTLENLLICSPNVFPMFENINLDVMGESERSTEEPQKLGMVDLFYHDENHLFKLGYSLVTSTKPDTVFEIDRLIDIFSNSFCIFVKRNRTDIASEIFTNGYSKGNFDFCDHSSILKYLDTYEAIWEILKLKAPQLTLEISFEDILNEPQETVKKISQLTGVSFEIENPPHQSIKNLHSPFREHYAFRFTAPCCP